jgi:prepilin-type N-terminal cleavage/methylation domain-containing protein
MLKWRKVFTLIELMIVVAIIGIAAPVSAAENPSNYVVVKGGIYAPSKTFDVRNINGGGIDRVDTKTGFDGEFAIGHYFLPVFATEMGVGYLESKGSPAVSPGETNLKVLPVLVTAKGLLPLGEIEPYCELGIGAYFTKLNVTGNLGNFSSSTKGAFGLHAGVGVNFNITEDVFLGVEGRYLWAKPSFSASRVQDIDLGGFTLTADLGFRF